MAKHNYPKHRKSPKPPVIDSSYIGREVYFEMSKKKIYKNCIALITPYKSYKIVRVEHNNLPTIIADNNMDIDILMGVNICAHLRHLTTWKLRRIYKEPADIREAKRLVKIWKKGKGKKIAKAWEKQQKRIEQNSNIKYVGHPDQLPPIKPGYENIGPVIVEDK